MPVGAGHDFVVRHRARPTGDLEAVAHLHALDRLDAHQRTGQPRVESAVPVDVRSKARRQPVRDDLDDSPERVTVLVGLVDLRDHGRTCPGVEAADRVGVESRDVLNGRKHASGRRRSPDRDHMSNEAHVEGLVEEGARHGAEGYPGGCLAGARALEDVACLGEVVLLHADQVGMARSWPRERCVAGQALEYLGVDGVGRHHLVPFGPLRVRDGHRHGPTDRLPVPHATEEGDGILLELHPGPAAVAEPASGQRCSQVGRRDRHAGRQPLDDRDQGRTVRLACREPSEHERSLSRARLSETCTSRRASTRT